MLKRVLFVVLLALPLVACKSGDDGEGMEVPVAVYELLMDEGMTCEVQASASELSPEGWMVLRQLVGDAFTVEEFAEVMNAREVECDMWVRASADSVDVAIQPLAGINASHNVELIEVDGNPNSPVIGTGIDVDDASTGYMCGRDPGASADLIWEFNRVPYSHYYRRYPRYDGIGGFGELHPTSSASIDACGVLVSSCPRSS